MGGPWRRGKISPYFTENIPIHKPNRVMSPGRSAVTARGLQACDQHWSKRGRRAMGAGRLNHGFLFLDTKHISCTLYNSNISFPKSRKSNEKPWFFEIEQCGEYKHEPFFRFCRS
jgi:hypothetical protein